jgi:soluble lytic murein transglycosylase
MRVSQAGHYQKSALKEPVRRVVHLLAVFALNVFACLGAYAQGGTTAKVGAVPSVGPAIAGPSTTLISLPADALTGLPASVQTPALAAVAIARQANQSKQWSVLAAVVPQAKSDLLGMYPEYWLLRYQLGNPPADQPSREELQRFLETNAGSYLADRLRADWILAAASNGDFATVRWLGPVSLGDTQVNCALLEAQHMTGQPVTAAQALKVFSPGSACWNLFDQLVADGVLSWDALAPLLRNAIEANKPSDARKLAKYMFEPALFKAFDTLLKDPMKWVAVQPRVLRNRAEQELVTLALGSLARKDLTVGNAYLRRQWAASLPKQNMAWVQSQFALAAALNLDRRADGWYREAGDVPMTDYNAAWKVRVALRQPQINWNWVVASIDHMSVSQRSEPVWVYWRGRGLDALGHHAQAREAYTSIANQFNFYGQLAAEELGQPITVPPPAAPVTEAELAQAQANPGLQRAILLFRLGWRAEAVPEWNFALRGMSDRQLLAAAELARTENIYDRVINTSERTQNEFDFSQRFIAPFEARVTAKAHQVGLDPAWVYGLIRQESRFIMDARSSAGASGLMQLLPTTAKWVANKIGLGNFNLASVNDFDINTVLGTHYLNMVLQDMSGSEVLATAGYNAGPRRPRNWRATLSHSIEGAIFVETIPFNETRLYVKNVLSNAAYYAALFTGRPQSLKARLGSIVPLGAEQTADLP